MGKLFALDTPLHKESIRMAELLYGYEETGVMKKDLSKDFVVELQTTAISQKNLIVSSFGTTGSGKSWQVARLEEKYCEFTGKTRELANVAFTITDALTAAENADRGGVVTLDEQVQTFGPGSGVEKGLLKNIEMTVRAQKLSFFFLAPIFVDHAFHYFLRTWQILGPRKFDPKVPVERQWTHTKSLVYDDLEHPLGYIVTESPRDLKFMKRYEEKKDKFITEIRGRRGSRRPFYLLDKAFELIQKPGFVEKWINPLASVQAKQSLISQFTKGEMFTINDFGTLKSHIEYAVAFDPNLEKYRELKTRMRVEYKMKEKFLQGKVLKELKKRKTQEG